MKRPRGLRQPAGRAARASKTGRQHIDLSVYSGSIASCVSYPCSQTAAGRCHTDEILMGITSSQLLSGANPYGQCDVILFELNGYESWNAGEAERALEILTAQHLADHAPDCPARSSGARSFGHLFEHACIAIQNRAGADLACRRVQSIRPLPAFAAAIPCYEQTVCQEAARGTDEMLSLYRSGGSSSAAAERLLKVMELARRRMLPVQDREMIRTARARDIPAMRLVGRVVVLGQGSRQQRLSATKTTGTNVVGNDLAANKDYTRRVLADLGLPAPKYERVYRLRAAVEAARRIGFPVVVKPNNGSMGSGVCIGLTSARDVRAAYRKARESGRSVLVEELVKGFDYRLLVIDGRCRAAAQRVPAHVVGDGRRNVEQLIEAANADPRRGSGSTSSWTRIELDDRAERLLADAGLTHSSIPAAGQLVYLRRNANTSDGGTAVDVTDEVHPDNLEIAERAAVGIGLDIAGVDFLTEDISRSMWETGGKICEINSRPGIRKHLWPAVGRPRDVISPIIDMLFPGGGNGRIPIVLVVGNGDVDRTARLLARLLRAHGKRVGLATTADGEAHKSARRLLLDPRAQAAVLALEPGDVCVRGLGLNACDLTLIVNASSRPHEPELRDAIQIAARCARNEVMLPDSDSTVVALEDGGVTPLLSRIEIRAHASDAVVNVGGMGTSIPASAATLEDALAVAAARRLGVEPATIVRELSQSQAATTRRSSNE